MYHTMHQPAGRGLGAMPPSSHPILQPSSPLNPGRSSTTYNIQAARQSTPERLRNNPEIVDIHNESITEADARRQLSTYVIIRIEKSCYDIDDEGNPAEPTWEKVSRVTETDISQHEAARKVIELNKDPKFVTDKKRELPSPLQRQIERARNDLQERESDTRYEYTLAQLESKLKKIEHSPDHHSKRDKRSSDRRRSKGSSRSKSKKQRVAVTIYFKRAPGPGVNCMRMLEAKRQQRDISPPASMPISVPLQPQQQPAQLARPPISQLPHDSPQPPFQSPPHVQPDKHPNLLPDPHQNLSPNHSPHHPPNSAPRPPPNPPAHRPPSRLMPNRNPPSPSRGPPSVVPAPSPPQNIPRTMGKQDKKDNPAIARIKHQASVESYQSPRSSAASESSFASDDDDAEILTPASSVVESSSRYTRERDRGQSRYRRHRDRDESFELEVARRHNKRDRRYTVRTSSSRGDSPLPPAPDPINTAADIDLIRRIEKTVYLQGRRDEQTMGQRNMAPAPQIIQPIPGVRTVRPHEARQHIYGDDIGPMNDQFSGMGIGENIHHPREMPRTSEYTTPRTRCPYYSDPQVWMPESGREESQRRRAQAYMRMRRQQARDSEPNASSGYSDRQQGLADYRHQR